MKLELEFARERDDYRASLAWLDGVCADSIRGLRSACDLELCRTAGFVVIYPLGEAICFTGAISGDVPYSELDEDVPGGVNISRKRAYTDRERRGLVESEIMHRLAIGEDEQGGLHISIPTMVDTWRFNVYEVHGDERRYGSGLILDLHGLDF